MYCHNHAPHALEEKECGFNCASFGMIGLESCYGAVNKILFHENNFNSLSLLKLLSVNPRKIMGFDNDLFLKERMQNCNLRLKREMEVF